MILININYDTSASASLPSQASSSTIAEHISITSSHLDYQQQNFQNDGEYLPLQTRKYHTNDDSEAENEIGDEELSSINRGPYFELSAPKNITAIAGQSAYLNCRVRNLGNKTVSWLRHRDLMLLTVGKETYTPDQRFQSVHNPHTNDWSLKILYPQKKDSDIYECQISTIPPISFSVMLTVVEPTTFILGQPEMFIDTTSTINLTCIVQGLNEPPTYIQWTHNGYEINYDSARGGVSVITEKSEITTSYLLIQRAKPSDSGKYICSPSHANSAGILVHVLHSEHPAAIQGTDRIQIKVYLLCFTISFTWLHFLKGCWSAT
ncbi:hypothetical protein PVAND_010605 [Polypedilum vanderplanki]|uniref:Ig-like domain-containing protein n=1 Tax=Polypedilum vanderplanki TaxID=319348 RepID=A0A9J6CG36_POLVA|nr:hypothetical protein PVAND_010605 [Polypedilum vanderplanki]